MKIILYGKRILAKYPRLITLAAKLFNIINFNIIIIKGKNNEVNKDKSFLKKCKIEIYGDGNTVELGEKCYLENCKIKIFGNNNKIILKNFVVAYDNEYHIEDNSNRIQLGEKTLITGKTHLACIEGTSINIGDYCLFSSNILFRTGDSHSILDSEGERINHSKTITIGNHVWIGNQVTINKGVNIGDDSIVGSNAVVTKSFNENNIIIAGTPAKVIKKDINWDINRK